MSVCLFFILTKTHFSFGALPDLLVSSFSRGRRAAGRSHRAPMQSHLRHESPSPRIHLILPFLHRAQTLVLPCRELFVARGFDLESKERPLSRPFWRVAGIGLESWNGESFSLRGEVSTIVGESCVMPALCVGWKANSSTLYQCG